MAAVTYYHRSRYDPGRSNISQANHTYYTYLLFAKPDTRQTYQIYVGKDPHWKPTEKVQMVRASFPDFPYIFNQGTWPAQWKRDVSDGGGNGYDPSTGIETLTLDMNGYADFQNDYDKTKATHNADLQLKSLTMRTSTSSVMV